MSTETKLTSEIIGLLSENKGYKTDNLDEQSILNNLADRGVVKTPEGKNGYKLSQNITMEMDDSGKVVVTKSPEAKFAAVFFDRTTDELLGGKAELPKAPETYHVTMGMTNINEALANPYLQENLGKNTTIKVIGEGNDGKNQGFAVEVEKEILEGTWKKVTKKIKETGEVKERVPHITLSMAEDGKAVDTGFIDFDKETQHLELQGTLGIMMEVGLSKTGKVITDIKDLQDLQKFTVTYEVDEKGLVRRVDDATKDLSDTRAETRSDTKQFGDLEENIQGHGLERDEHNKSIIN